MTEEIQMVLAKHLSDHVAVRDGRRVEDVGPSDFAPLTKILISAKDRQDPKALESDVRALARIRAIIAKSPLLTDAFEWADSPDEDDIKWIEEIAGDYDHPNGLEAEELVEWFETPALDRVEQEIRFAIEQERTPALRVTKALAVEIETLPAIQVTETSGGPWNRLVDDVLAVMQLDRYGSQPHRTIARRMRK